MVHNASSLLELSALTDRLADEHCRMDALILCVRHCWLNLRGGHSCHDRLHVQGWGRNDLDDRILRIACWADGTASPMGLRRA